MKKFVSVLLSIIMLLSITAGLNFSAQAATPTQSQAVSWAESKASAKASLDYDGQYGAQCVDLIYYYYQFLGASVMGGDASAYISNTLPSGWKRISYTSGFVAQPGDIAVWKVNHSCGTCNTDSYGHVGIIISADSAGFNAVSQNYNYNQYCTKDWFNASALACVIRPNFGGTAVDPLTFDIEGASNIKENSVTIKFHTSNPYNQVVSKVGIRIKKTSESNWSKTYEETLSSSINTIGYLNTEYEIGSGKEINYSLSAGTSYTWQAFAVTGGKTYYSDSKTFKTPDPPTEKEPDTAKPESDTKAKSEATPPTFSIENASNITENSVTVKFSTSNPSNQVISKIGIRIKKSSALTWGKTYEETLSSSVNTLSTLNTEYVIGSGKEIDYSLTAGTKYTWQAFAVAGGKTYYSDSQTFTTAEPKTEATSSDSATKESATKGQSASSSTSKNQTQNTPSTNGQIEQDIDMSTDYEYEDYPTDEEYFGDDIEFISDGTQAPHKLSWSEIVLIILVVIAIAAVAVVLIRKKLSKKS